MQRIEGRGREGGGREGGREGERGPGQVMIAELRTALEQHRPFHSYIMLTAAEVYYSTIHVDLSIHIDLHVLIAAELYYRAPQILHPIKID